MSEESPFTEDKPEFDEDKLGVVAKLVMEMIDLEEEIKGIEDDLKERKKKCRDLNEQQIPEKLLEMGVTQLKMADGTTITMSVYYSAKIPDVRKDEAFMFLKANGHDSIIKSKVDCSFGKGDEERSNEEQLVGFLSRQQIPFNQKRGIHHSTLKAFVKEQIEGGAELPLDLFGVYIGNQIKVKGAG